MSMHLGILLLKIYISSKTYVLKDQTLYIFFKNKQQQQQKNVWQEKIERELFKPLSYKLQWLCNGATPQCKDKGPFLVFGILGILRKKSHLSACKEAKTATLMRTPLF